MIAAKSAILTEIYEGVIITIVRQMQSLDRRFPVWFGYGYKICRNVTIREIRRLEKMQTSRFMHMLLTFFLWLVKKMLLFLSQISGIGKTWLTAAIFGHGLSLKMGNLYRMER